MTDHDYYVEHRDAVKKRVRDYNIKVKLLALSYYGGRCAVCGITNPAFLTIDHINNDGAEHRRNTSGLRGNRFYLWLIRNDFPSGFQVLCWNHNWLKHLGSVGHTDDKYRRYKQKVKRIVVDQYGGHCSICGETNIDLLTIDHVNGGGNKHRAEVGSGVNLCRWIIRNDFPTYLAVKCWNCNCGLI